jgi:Fungal Zn(2)-Cys(6) binuclear cluster domain.
VQNRSDCTPDLACTRCRERKIRCGRERPQCSNCDREDGVTCVYQNPVKRVNHLKLLWALSPSATTYRSYLLTSLRCDSVEILQERLQTIESHLGRLSNGLNSGLTSEVAFLTPSSSRGSNSIGDRATEGNDRDESDNGDDDLALDSLRSLPDMDMPDLQISRNHSDMVDRYHGRSSLFVLCSRFRIQALATSSINVSGTLRDILQNICDIAGSTEPFPPFSDNPLIKLLPQKQAVTAVGHFIQHVDCTTDIFVPQSLMGNLERVYSQPQQPGDEAWAVCFNVITLLVLGMEISTQAPTALVGDFARSLLPSRAALVSSRLLTTPRLINVQTLILLV